MTTDDELTALRCHANEVVKRIKQELCEGAINWADLSCVQAAEVRTDGGFTYLEVLIEEASPEAYELQRQVAEGLDCAGWKGVVVRTEW